MSDPLLRIRDLEISTGNARLVNRINLDISGKSVTGLVGESGSGKTLTALSIMGLLPKGVRATAGSVTLLNRDSADANLLHLPEKEMNHIRGSRISMIFQEPMTSLNPTMKCGPQATEPLRIHKGLSSTGAREKILDLFNEVKLPDVENIFNAWPHQLSGGQRQRVMIAMALSTHPDLLIADEPTTALDVTVQKSILELLLALKEKYNLGVLFITHDLMVLKQIADRIAVMYRGELVEEASAAALLENPQTPYAKGLLACRPSLEEKPERLPTIGDFMSGYAEQDKPTAGQPRSVDNDVILSVKDLEVTFISGKRTVHAVDSVSFDVFRGETLGLVGESGCGKTTLGRTIVQLIRPDNGSVSYNGVPLDRLTGKELRKTRRKIQIVFQDPYSSLNPGKTIGDIIAEPMIIHRLEKNKKEKEARVHQLLEQTGLPGEAYNLYPHQFSGGQRQRIGIARALACQPEFIVLDESVSALDVSVQAQILNLLNDLKRAYELTYIFISHDLTVVKYMSDRVLIMSDGRMIESGTSEKIYMHPENDYTRKLINAIPS